MEGKEITIKTWVEFYSIILAVAMSCVAFSIYSIDVILKNSNNLFHLVVAIATLLFTAYGYYNLVKLFIILMKK